VTKHFIANGKKGSERQSVEQQESGCSHVPAGSQAQCGTGSQTTCSVFLHALDLKMMLEKNLTRCMPQKSSASKKRRSRKDLRDLDVKISFLEGLVKRDQDYVEALQLLGDYYTQRGRFDHSLKVDQQLSRLEPRNPMVFYNLACSYSLNQDFDRAVIALEQALALGYRDFRWLSRDPDLRQLRKLPVYRPIADKIRKMMIRVA
jgi:tetratricopeptide (TPR) repeat protein